MSETAVVALVLGIAGSLVVVTFAVSIDVIRYWLRKRRRATLRAIVRDQALHGSCAMKVTWSKDAAVTSLSYVPREDWAATWTEEAKEKAGGDESVVVVRKMVGIMSHQCGPDCAFPDFEHVPSSSDQHVRGLNAEGEKK